MSLFTLIIIISFASLGFRAITDKGMILYFLRKPFEDCQKLLKEHEENIKEIEKFHGKDAISTQLHLKTLQLNWLLYLAKPFILCSTCMASVHTIAWWLILDMKIDAKMFLVMLSVAFVNTLLWSIVELIKKYK